MFWVWNLLLFSWYTFVEHKADKFQEYFQVQKQSGKQENALKQACKKSRMQVYKMQECMQI